MFKKTVHILIIHTVVRLVLAKRLFKTSLNKTTSRGSFKLILIKPTKNGAQLKKPLEKKTKRSRHWEDNETRILVSE